MDEQMRSQIYLEMSKDAIMDYLYEYRAAVSHRHDTLFDPPTDADMLALWNDRFARKCMALGLSVPR